jgi:hypothetical protein
VLQCLLSCAAAAVLQWCQLLHLNSVLLRRQGSLVLQVLESCSAALLHSKTRLLSMLGGAV